MLTRWKSIVASLLLAIRGIWGIGGIVEWLIPQWYENLSDEEYYAEVFTPKVRIAIATDTHILDGMPDSQTDKLTAFYREAYRYAEAQEQTQLDAILFAGDCTNLGSSSALKTFFKIAEENAKGDTVVRAVMGNHVFYSSETTSAKDRFLDASGYDSADCDLVIGGYHFLMLSQSSHGGDGHCYNAAKQLWLAGKLAKAALEGGDKPIFIVCHTPPVGTVYTSDEEEATHDLDNILKMYPQAVVLTGHTHSPANDPKSIWQGDYTVVNCGSMAYYGGGLAGICEKYVYPTDHTGGNNAFVPGNVTLNDAADYLIIEADSHNAVRITVRNVYAEEDACVYYLRSFSDSSKFRYGDDRVEKTQMPVFASDDALSLKCVENTSVEFSIAQAIGEAYTQHYRLELYDMAGDKLDTEYVLSDRFYTPVPEVLYGGFQNLMPDTEYRVQCIAVSAYAVESEPISRTFRTAKS